jgi:hypothetical protein
VVDLKRPTPALTLKFKSHYVELTTREVIIGIVAVLALAAAAYLTPGDLVARLVAALATVSGIALGALLQPRPEPRDISQEAAAAVIGLADVSNSLQDASTSIASIRTLSTNAKITAATNGALSDLSGAVEDIGYAVAAWEDVSPGAVDALLARQEAGRNIMRKLEKNGNPDE